MLQDARARARGATTVTIRDGQSGKGSRRAGEGPGGIVCPRCAWCVFFTNFSGFFFAVPNDRIYIYDLGLSTSMMESPS